MGSAGGNVPGTRTVEELLAEHLPAIGSWLRLRAGAHIKARESCSDLVQSVCREVLEQADGFDFRGDAQFRSWLYTMALRKLVDRDRYYAAQRRDHARERSLDGEREARGDAAFAEACRTVASPSSHAVSLENLDLIERAFDGLKDEHKDVIILHRLGGLSHREIGEQLGRSEEASKILLRRALARLTRLISELDA